MTERREAAEDFNMVRKGLLTSDVRKEEEEEMGGHFVRN